MLSNSVLRHRKLVWMVEGSPGSLFLRSLKAELSPTGMLTSQGSDMTATDPETCCYWNLMNVNTSPGGGWPSQRICQDRSHHKLEIQLPYSPGADALVSSPGPSVQAPACTWFPVIPHFLFR